MERAAEGGHEDRFRGLSEPEVSGAERGRLSKDGRVRRVGLRSRFLGPPHLPPRRELGLHVGPLRAQTVDLSARGETVTQGTALDDPVPNPASLT